MIASKTHNQNLRCIGILLCAVGLLGFSAAAKADVTVTVTSNAWPINTNPRSVTVREIEILTGNYKYGGTTTRPLGPGESDTITVKTDGDVLTELHFDAEGVAQDTFAYSDGGQKNVSIEEDDGDYLYFKVN